MVKTFPPLCLVHPGIGSLVNSQQIGKPQEVYDNPVNLFVAKFLGTPPINVFEGAVRGETVYIGEDAVLPAKGVPDQEIYLGIRPEGFLLQEDGPLHCSLGGVEVMGRDISIVCTHKCAPGTQIRAIIGAENAVDTACPTARFAVKPNKAFLFAQPRRACMTERIRGRDVYGKANPQPRRACMTE